jgi:outer membrane protein OmpA-like peptidoglycan-associated protein
MKPAIRLMGSLLLLGILAENGLSQTQKGQSGIGLFASGIKLIGGNADHCVINYASGISLKYIFSKSITGEFTIGLGWVRPRDPDSYFKIRSGAPYRTYIYPWNISARYNLLPGKTFNPFLALGIGLIHWDLRDVSKNDTWFPIPVSGITKSGMKTNVTIIGSLGTNIFLSQTTAIDLAIRYSLLINQKFDTIGLSYIGEGEDKNNGLVELRLGFTFYIGGSKDSDGDGIENKLDQCPFEPEDIDGYQDGDGCPDPDNDNDGVLDEQDGAPNLPEDIDGFEDEDGVPDMDNDNDGIPDIQDACPNESEDFDGFQDEDGCPELDNDGDGIFDYLDKCPNQAETMNGYQDEDGCPDEKPEALLPGQGKTLVLRGITFETGKTVLTAEAKNILDQIIDALEENPDARLEIRGYTDNIGSAAANLNLSQRRAEAVKDYLVKNGIAFQKLRAIGYGEANPIAANETKEGRAENRRIEFIRIEE